MPSIRTPTERLWVTDERRLRLSASIVPLLASLGPGRGPLLALAYAYYLVSSRVCNGYEIDQDFEVHFCFHEFYYKLITNFKFLVGTRILPTRILNSIKTVKSVNRLSR